MTLANDENLTIIRLAHQIRKKQLSPVELTESFLARIREMQPLLNAFISVLAERALQEARRAEAEIAGGSYRGALHGIPISLKDLFLTQGIRTTAGSRILRDYVPRSSAYVAERLQDAGTILLGKTNLHEFAFGVTNVNPHYGPVRNPWNRDRVPGGSSGGSAAAVAAGLCVASLGTDTGGSVRIPAAACGCVGLKPTFGLVPVDGVFPLSHTLDHVGPICRNVEDTAVMLRAILPDDNGCAGAVRKRALTALRQGIGGLRVGVSQRYFFERVQIPVRKQVVAAIQVLADAGAEIREIRFDGLRDTEVVGGTITVAEAVLHHWERLHRRRSEFGADLKKRLTANLNMRAVVYMQALQARDAYRRRFLEAMRDVDVVATPTLPVAAPVIGDQEVTVGRTRENVRLALLRFTRPGNLTGLPAISLPCGFTPEGLPTGLQLIGHEYREDVLLRAAYAFEQATPWHRRFPGGFAQQ